MYEVSFDIIDGKSTKSLGSPIVNWFSRQKNGKYLLSIKSITSYKTWLQIKTVKGVLIPKISEYLGETKKEVEKRLKIEYGVIEPTNYKGEPAILIKSFADYTKPEMTAFISGVLDHCEFDLDFVIDLQTREKLEGI